MFFDGCCAYPTFLEIVIINVRWRNWPRVFSGLCVVQSVRQLPEERAGLVTADRAGRRAARHFLAATRPRQ
jgi:hypothetical protein